MEEVAKALFNYAWALFVERWVELVAGGILLVLWRWWTVRKLQDRISALEAQASQPVINQTINFNVGADGHDHDRQLRNAVEAETVHGLKETINSLPQHSLGDGHTYAKLPDGTNIVTMADGSIRLALPVRLSAAFSGSLDGSLSASVRKSPLPIQNKPEGR